MHACFLQSLSVLFQATWIWRGVHAGICGLPFHIVYVGTGSLLLAVIVAILIGVVINLISGIIVAYFNIPPFVATLGMQMSVRGAVYLLTTV